MFKVLLGKDFATDLTVTATIEAGEKAYVDCKHDLDRKVGLWSIGPNDAFDPSRPYKDGVDVVVVYRQHYASVSIYANPKSEYEFANTVIAETLFAGHPKACGSPRGREFSEAQAIEIFKEVCHLVN